MTSDYQESGDRVKTGRAQRSFREGENTLYNTTMVDVSSCVCSDSQDE